MKLTVQIVSMAALVLVIASPFAPTSAQSTPDTLAQLTPNGGVTGGASLTGPRTGPRFRPQPEGPGPTGVSPRPGDNTTGDESFRQQSLPTSPPPRIGLFPEFGERLLNAGVDFHGIVQDHLLANPSAGVNPGHVDNLFAFRPAVDLDLQRIVGIPGGNIHIGLTFYGLRADMPQIVPQAGGVLTGFQETSVTQTNLVSLFTYEQRLLNDKLSIEAGRTNVYNYFLLPNSLDPLTHYSSTFQVVGDFDSAPYPVWGGRAAYRFTPKWYVQGGVFTDNYRTALNYGDRLGLSGATGAQILGEVGYRSEFTNADYPANFELGYERNTRTGRSNLKGTGAPAIPLLQAANYPGGGVIFSEGQQVLWRGARRDVGPPANVAVYGSLTVATDKPQPIDLDALVGVNLTGFVPGRPFDALGLQLKYQRLSQVEANGETRRQRIVAGPGPEQARDGFVFEAVTNIQLTPAIVFRPFAEYFINPDNYYPPSAQPSRPKDGFEAGFFAIVSLGRLLGTSIKPF